MAYEFKTLGSVEALTEVPENANALVEVDGAIKRVPGGALGGNGGAWDFMIRGDGDGNFTWVKGDHISLIDKLVAGQCPSVCIFYTNGDTEYPSACYSVVYYMEISSGSGTWVNMNGQNGGWFFNAIDGIVQQES